MPSEFAVGKRWRTRFDVTTPEGVVFQSEQRIRITARETVKVPARSFNAFRLEGRGYSSNPLRATESEVTRWYVPAFQWPVARDELHRRAGKVIFTQRLELVSCKPA